MNEIAEMAFEMARASNDMVRVGMDAERKAMQPRLRALVSAYDRAKADPNTVIPTYLEVLIESFRQ